MLRRVADGTGGTLDGTREQNGWGIFLVFKDSKETGQSGSLLLYYLSVVSFWREKLWPSQVSESRLRQKVSRAPRYSVLPRYCPDSQNPARMILTCLFPYQPTFTLISDAHCARVTSPLAN